MKEKQSIEIIGQLKESIESVATKMIDFKNKGYIAYTTFMGIYLSTENLNSVKEIVDALHQGYEKKAEAYRNSPQYAIDKENARLKQLHKEEQAENLMKQFSTLDFNNTDQIVEWLGEAAKYSYEMGFKNNLQIINVLKRAGFQSFKEFNTTKNSDFEHDTVEHYIKLAADKEEIGRYIVSRAIEGIEFYGSMDQTSIYWSEMYRERFKEKEEYSQQLKKSL